MVSGSHNRVHGREGGVRILASGPFNIMSKQQDYFIFDDLTGDYVCRFSSGGLILAGSESYGRWSHDRFRFRLERARRIIKSYKTLNWQHSTYVNGNLPKMALRITRVSPRRYLKNRKEGRKHRAASEPPSGTYAVWLR